MRNRSGLTPCNIYQVVFHPSFCVILLNSQLCLQVRDVILERYPELLTSAALYIEMGSTRAVELGALLVGNMAFNEAGAEALAKMDIAVDRLVSLMVEGGDRARELGTMALANLTCINKFAHQLLAEKRAMEVILGVQESGTTGRAREAACRVVANCAVYRLKGNGVKMPQGTGKVLSEHMCDSLALLTHTFLLDQPFDIVCLWFLLSD